MHHSVLIRNYNWLLLKNFCDLIESFCNARDGKIQLYTIFPTKLSLHKAQIIVLCFSNGEIVYILWFLYQFKVSFSTNHKKRSSKKKINKEDGFPSSVLILLFFSYFFYCRVYSETFFLVVRVFLLSFRHLNREWRGYLARKNKNKNNVNSSDIFGLNLTKFGSNLHAQWQYWELILHKLDGFRMCHKECYLNWG